MLSPAIARGTPAQGREALAPSRLRDAARAGARCGLDARTPITALDGSQGRGEERARSTRQLPPPLDSLPLSWPWLRNVRERNDQKQTAPAVSRGRKAKRPIAKQAQRLSIPNIFNGDMTISDVCAMPTLSCRSPSSMVIRIVIVPRHNDLQNAPDVRGGLSIWSLPPFSAVRCHHQACSERQRILSHLRALWRENRWTPSPAATATNTPRRRQSRAGLSPSWPRN
jgi:hypothetical protein